MNAIKVSERPWEDCGLYGAEVIDTDRRTCPLCKGGGIVTPEIWRDEIDSNKVRANLIAVENYERQPYKDTRKSTVHSYPCWRCDGRGWVPVEEGE